MNPGHRSRNFWLGNALLALAMLMLFFMGPISDALGIWSVVIWMALAGVGMALLMSAKSDEPPAAD